MLFLDSKFIGKGYGSTILESENIKKMLICNGIDGLLECFIVNIRNLKIEFLFSS